MNKQNNHQTNEQLFYELIEQRDSDYKLTTSRAFECLENLITAIMTVADLGPDEFRMVDMQVRSDHLILFGVVNRTSDPEMQSVMQVTIPADVAFRSVDELLLWAADNHHTTNDDQPTTTTEPPLVDPSERKSKPLTQHEFDFDVLTDEQIDQLSLSSQTHKQRKYQ